MKAAACGNHDDNEKLTCAVWAAFGRVCLEIGILAVCRNRMLTR